MKSKLRLLQGDKKISSFRNYFEEMLERSQTWQSMYSEQRRTQSLQEGILFRMCAYVDMHELESSILARSCFYVAEVVSNIDLLNLKKTNPLDFCEELNVEDMTFFSVRQSKCFKKCKNSTDKLFVLSSLFPEILLKNGLSRSKVRTILFEAYRMVYNETGDLFYCDMAECCDEISFVLRESSKCFILDYMRMN